MEPDPSLARLRFDRFELDEADARLTCAGEPVPLAPKPFAVLCTLARSPRRLVTKNALLDAVWGHRFVAESVLKSAMSEVRAASATTQAAALHRDGIAPRVSLHRRAVGRVLAKRGCRRAQRRGRGRPSRPGSAHRLVPRRRRGRRPHPRDRCLAGKRTACPQRSGVESVV